MCCVIGHNQNCLRLFLRLPFCSDKISGFHRLRGHQHQTLPNPAAATNARNKTPFKVAVLIVRTPWFLHPMETLLILVPLSAVHLCCFDHPNLPRLNKHSKRCALFFLQETIFIRWTTAHVIPPVGQHAMLFLVIVGFHCLGPRSSINQSNHWPLTTMTDWRFIFFKISSILRDVWF